MVSLNTCWNPGSLYSEDSEVVLAGHSLHGEAFDEGPRQAAYLMAGMSNVHWKISTENTLAQRFFDQGIAQLHGFAYFEAERSFRQVAAIDPSCAIAYWGMARANANNVRRAKGFIAKAVEKKVNASELERRLIEALATMLDGRDEKESKSDSTKRKLEAYAKELESLTTDFDDNIELKALLVLTHWENEKQDIKIQSRLGLDAILDQIFAVNPRHPAHHFRIHLWDNNQRKRALESAAASGPSLPGIAHMWHMPGHTYFGLKRFHDAAWQQEASARVDHAHMMRDRILPDQIHNFAHNNEWLIRTWMKTGQARQAIELAKNMCELPRHPKFNTLEKGSANFGRLRLIESLVNFESWDELLALAESPYLAPTESAERQDERLAWMTVALAMTNAVDEASRSMAALDERLTEARRQTITLERELKDILNAKPAKGPRQSASRGEVSPLANSKPPTLTSEIPLDEFDWDELAESPKVVKPKPFTIDEKTSKDWTKSQRDKADEFRKLQSRIDKLVRYLHLDRAYLAASQKRYGAAVVESRFAGKLIPVHQRLRWLRETGRTREAVGKAKDLVKKMPGEVLILSEAIVTAHTAHQSELTRDWLDEFATISSAMDRELALSKSISLIAKELGWKPKAEGRLSTPSDIGERPPLDDLGPVRWSPYRSPSWQLEDLSKTVFSSKVRDGKPTILVFYLGLGCLHCVEQLQEISPRLEAFRDRGFEVLAISSESQESLRESLANYSEEMKITLLPNPDLGCFKDFRCFDDFDNVPLHGTFVIDDRGRVVWQDVGAEPFMDIDFLLEESKRLLDIHRQVNQVR